MFWRSQIPSYAAKDANALLTQSSKTGNLEGVCSAIISGADVNTSNKTLSTPLIHAAWNGYVGIADVLIRAGADVNWSNLRGNSALHFSYEREHLDFSLLLLSRGAKEIVNKEGKIPRDLSPKLHAIIKDRMMSNDDYDMVRRLRSFDLNRCASM